MLDCRIVFVQYDALLAARLPQPDSLPPSSPGEISSLLPARGRIVRASDRRAACAIAEGIDLPRWTTSRRLHHEHTRFQQTLELGTLLLKLLTPYRCQLVVPRTPLLPS